jgi:hypothetical protein
MRLERAYSEAKFEPPYPCYPFRRDFFAELRGASPRELLKRCDAHRRECLRRKQVIETGEAPMSPVRVDLQPLERRFEQLLAQAPVKRLIDEEDEAALDGLIESACLAIAEVENPAPADIDAAVDLRFPGRGAYEALHARIRLIFRATQAPKSIDHQIIANCATQFYGRAASPAAIQTVQEQIKLRGGSGTDIATLTRGTFYAYTEGMKAPPRRHPALPVGASTEPARRVGDHRPRRAHSIRSGRGGALRALPTREVAGAPT